LIHKKTHPELKIFSPSNCFLFSSTELSSSFFSSSALSSPGFSLPLLFGPPLAQFSLSSALLGPTLPPGFSLLLLLALRWTYRKRKKTDAQKEKEALESRGLRAEGERSFGAAEA